MPLRRLRVETRDIREKAGNEMMRKCIRPFRNRCQSDGSKFKTRSIARASTVARGFEDRFAGASE
jgi:hypothetical protein